MSDDKLVIFDTTLRDGEQSPGIALTPSEKLLIAQQLEKLKVDVIEAGFAASSPGDWEGVNLIAKNIKNSTIASLARCHPDDIEQAWEAIKVAKDSRIHVFTSTSQIHMEHMLRKSKEEVLKDAKESVKYAKKRDEIFLISKGFVASDTDWDETITIAQAKEAAKVWTGYLNESLREMKIDHVDAYYYMGQNNVSVIKSEEIYKAFEDAKAQGKVSYLGISTHQNAANVLDAAADTGWFD